MDTQGLEVLGLYRNRTISLSTDTPSNATERSVIKEAINLILFSEAFTFYSLSVIIPVGCVCNILALATFLTKRMRKQSSCWYLAMLALADTIVLVTELIRQWLPNPRINVNVYNESQIACILVTYLSLVSRTLSSWTIVVFTIERTVCVMKPLKGIRKIANTSLAKKIIALEVSCSLLSATYIFFLSTVRSVGGKMECTSIEAKHDLNNSMSLIWILFSTFLPVTLVCILNAITIRKLSKLKEKRGDLFSQRNYDYAVNKNKVTLMLLTVSTCFILLSTPYLILWIWVNRLRATNAAEYHTIQAALGIVRVFYVLNFAINLALYSITGSKFRKQLLVVITCSKDDLSPDSSSLRRRSTHKNIALQVQRRRSTHGTLHEVVSAKPTEEEETGSTSEGIAKF